MQQHAASLSWHVQQLMLATQITLTQITLPGQITLTVQLTLPNSLHSTALALTDQLVHSTALVHVDLAPSSSEALSQLTPDLIARNSSQRAQQHQLAAQARSPQVTQNIPKLNPTKTPVRIRYATQRLLELHTPKLFYPETARDKNQRNTQLGSSAQNRSSQISLHSSS
ncbi:Ubiquitin-like superfamily protein isoform 1 [Dorcoceras hygrometricum]|uniref:Ubiquitin-like superfamily protein isoform 1 n=1 Tax=Dorcoceras hygrometricum TaxID=472368 RepID=A0A2Z7DJR7_9LAMI|nr:Ubiquitin-like superfamily protein isoform 1 [Dorcoceras hygrometricum]